MTSLPTIADVLLGFTLGAAGASATNRVAMEGLSFAPGKDGALEIGIRSMELAGLQGTLDLPAQLGDAALGTGGTWSLVPLAGANGTIRAQIIDAHLVFDANVTVPIRAGEIHFNDATVEHVGPDSRMGVSRLGVYVDAPNGRSYLYQFPANAVAGVEFERRGVLGARVADRGKLRLQEFGEAFMQQGPGAKGPGITEQARLLFERTSLSGELRLGDGRLAVPGIAAELVGRAESRNVVQLRSESVGRGLSAEIPSLSVRNATLKSGATQLSCDAITGALTLRLAIDGSQLHFAFEVTNLKLSGVRLRRSPA